MPVAARTTGTRASGTAVRRVLLPAAIALVLALAGCVAPPTRSGADAEPVTVRVMYGNGRGSIGSDVIDALASSTTASPVSIRDVTASVGADAVGAEDGEGDSLRTLQGGGADLTIVRAGRLALAGAKGLAVLEAPMVVQNDAQARLVAADPLALAMLDDLRPRGLVGLAIVPGSLRHLFGHGTAITTPDAISGKRVSVRPDLAVDATVSALGGIPDRRAGSARSAAVSSGAIRAIDTSLDQPEAVDLPAVVASNLTLYEKFDVVVIRKRVYDGLTSAQRDALRAQVHRAVNRALGARMGEETALSSWCTRQQAGAVRLPADAIAAFHAVLDPVADRLATTAAERALLARMRALHDGTLDPIGATCQGGSRPSAADFALAAVGPQTVLDGTWRVEATPAGLRAAGGDPQAVENNRGIWTFRIDHGRAVVDQPVGDDCTMRFTFAGDRVRLDMSADGNDSCGGLAIGTFERDGDTARFVWTEDIDGNPQFDQALFGTLTRTTG